MSTSTLANSRCAVSARCCASSIWFDSRVISAARASRRDTAALTLPSVVANPSRRSALDASTA